MNLLAEIRQLVTFSDSRLSDALRLTLVLGSRLGHEELNEWARRELQGYSNIDELPDYRILRGEPRGDFVGAHANANNAAVPPHLFEPEERDLVTTIYLRDGVGYWESVVDSGGPETLRYPLPHDLLVVYQRRLFQGMACVELYLPLPKSNIRGFLDAVRNRLLALIVAIEAEVGELSDDPQIKPPIANDRLEQIFHVNIQGNVQNLALGSPNSSMLAITQRIEPGDRQSLFRSLKELGLSDTDVDQLNPGLDSDPTPENPDSNFGPQVSSWVGRMVGKAGEGTWNVGLNAAGSLLAEALLRYYGVK